MKWYKDSLTVKNPKSLPAGLECKRLQLGGIGAYNTVGTNPYRLQAVNI